MRIEVKNAGGEVVWQHAELDEPIVEVVAGVVRITDFNTGTVVATYALKPGEVLATGK